MHTHAIPPPGDQLVRRRRVEDVDGYASAVGGVRIEAVRTGRGSAPNEVLTVVDERVTVTACVVGFPMRSRTILGDGVVVMACITAAAPGSRWCEIDLHPGALIVYGPGAEHTAVNLPGVGFTFAMADERELDQAAERLGIELDPVPRGQVFELVDQAAAHSMSSALSAVTRAADDGGGSLSQRTRSVVPAMARALCGEQGARRAGGRAGDHSRHIVHVAIDHAEAAGRIPTIAELCAVVHVSERRLRQAFVAEFDLPPTRFFRSWALEAARRRLLRAEPGRHTVTEIANDIGFEHLGRFAAHYKVLYGEAPSDTLRAVA